jgi:heterodisulfide reductase subunit B
MGRSFNEIKQLLDICYQCGTCTASCAIGLVSSAKNVRSLIQTMVHGSEETVFNDPELLWFCTTCYQCEDRCPQGIPLTTLLVELRNLAVRKGRIPASIQKEVKTLAAHGSTFAPVKGILSRRQKLGLPDLPQPDCEEIQTLLGLNTVKIPIQNKSPICKPPTAADANRDRHQYALFAGCTIPYRLPHLEASVRFVLDKLELSMVDLPFGCCPDPNGIHSYDSQMWYTLAARNLALAEERNLDIVTLCNGCYETLNYTRQKLNEDATLFKRVNSNLKPLGRQIRGENSISHFYQFLQRDIGYERLSNAVVHPLNHLRIAVHYGCHALRPKAMNPPEDPENPQWLWDFVENVLQAQPVHYLDETQCCGAGIREIDQESSLSITARKIQQMEDMQANAILVPCPTCFLQFDSGQRLLSQQNRSRIKGTPVFYLAELLALAMGADFNAIGLHYHVTKPDSEFL